MEECSFDDIQAFLSDFGENGERSAHSTSSPDKEIPCDDSGEFFPTLSDDEDGKSEPSEDDLINKMTGFSTKNAKISHSLLTSLFSDKQKYTLKTLQSSFNSSVDWITTAVITHKSSQKTTRNGKPFWIWKLSDLELSESVINLFLFSLTPEQANIPLGSVVALLNPDPMAKRSGDTTPNFGINNYKKVLYIGRCADFGVCQANNNSGKRCGNVINKSHGQFCLYHVKRNYQRMCSSRSELQCRQSGRITRTTVKRPSYTPQMPAKKVNGVSFMKAVSGYTDIVSQRTRDIMSSLTNDQSPSKTQSDDQPKLNGGVSKGRVILGNSVEDVFGSGWKEVKSAQSASRVAVSHFEDSQLDQMFQELSQREAMENKMSAITEKKCNVVTCKNCNYTATTQSQLCRQLGHSVSSHQAVMRFFTCRDCSSGFCYSFGKYPVDRCRVCDGVTWRRDSMFAVMKKKREMSDQALQITAPK